MEEELTINKEFAKKYDRYRKAEEYQKLKAKYGSASESSSSETEDDRAEAINPKLEADFFNTLACLKRNDPKIYSNNEHFFEDDFTSSNESSDDEPPKHKPMTLNDYERDVMLNRGGIYESEDVEEMADAPNSYYSELKEIKKSLVDATKDESDDDGDDFLKPKLKPTGSGNETTTTLENLDEYWKNPNLDKDEKFLRDYILQHKYLDPDEDCSESDSGGEESKSSDNDDDDGELFTKKQDTFERKYNFRFEEPDEEFVKSYPRTVEASVRRKDDKTKRKRSERKERKAEEKRKKLEELKRLKQLKREEIVEKIEKLREATGNTDIQFSTNDLNKDFDPEEYDRRMKDLFDDEFYAGEEEAVKPEFSDLDDDLGQEPDWDRYQCGEYDDAEYYDETDLPESEQPGFIMDCDYDPAAEKKKKLQNPNPNPSKRNKKKKSAFYAAVAKKKPTFDPSSGSFDRYLEEYYALDYEDLIGDLPCRFKYRQVPKQDFGLTAEEILSSDNRTLNSWCSLKHVVALHTPGEEARLARKFARKSRVKKKRHFALAKANQGPDMPNAVSDGNEALSGSAAEAPTNAKAENRKLNSKQRRRKKERESKLRLLGAGQNAERKGEKRKHGSRSNDVAIRKVAKMDEQRLRAYGLEPKKLLKKIKYGSKTNGDL